MADKHILVIDDNEDCRMLVKFFLEASTDWKVSMAKDGIEGITKAETQRPDVILLDFIMPKLNGLATYDVLKSNLFTCSIPIIFITAMAQDKVLARLKHTLAEGLIIKPFNLPQLEYRIKELCDW